MNQTDLSLVEAHIDIELQRLAKLLVTRQQIYQQLPAGQTGLPEQERLCQQLQLLQQLAQGKFEGLQARETHLAS